MMHGALQVLLLKRNRVMHCRFAFFCCLCSVVEASSCSVVDSISLLLLLLLLALMLMLPLAQRLAANCVPSLPRLCRHPIHLMSSVAHGC
jgi:hypothetical protein